MLIQGMTIQEMAKYLTSVSQEQLEKISENYSGFQVPLGTELNSEDSIFMAMICVATICKTADDNELRELAFKDMSEGEHYVVLAEMRKRNLI